MAFDEIKRLRLLDLLEPHPNKSRWQRDMDELVRGALARLAELESAESCRRTNYDGKPAGPRGRYKPRDLQSKLGYLVEECGEVLHAVGKALRWGTQGVNPEISVGKQETNREWILREVCDLRAAIDIVEEGLDLGDIEHPDQREEVKS